MTGESEGLIALLSRPTYQNRLRVVGRHLDLGGYHSINLIEIVGGFLVRAMRPGHRAPDAREFPHEDFAALLQTAGGARGQGPRLRTSHPLLPTGYEDFLRALGLALDEKHAEAIAITELGTFVAVNGVEPIETYHETTMAPLQMLLRPDDIGRLLDQAFHRRAAPTPSSRLGRMLRR